jgi:methionyl-tRNA formyltransferase
MKILCCLNADVVSSVALNLLLPSLAGHDVHVALSTRIGGSASNTIEPAPRAELRVAEQFLALDVVFPLVEQAAQPDNGRYLTFTELTRLRGIPVTPLPNPNAGEGLAFLQQLAPDLIVSIRYGAIFKAPAIAVPRLGILNLHAGLLPAYRGVIASFRALMAGERELGCTLHYITDGTIDTGPVVGQSRTKVDASKSLFAHVVALYPNAIAMVGDAIGRLTRGEQLPYETQSGGNYYTYPTAAEWEEFLRRGWRVADPSDLRDVFAKYR